MEDKIIFSSDIILELDKINDEIKMIKRTLDAFPRKFEFSYEIDLLDGKKSYIRWTKKRSGSYYQLLLITSDGQSNETCVSLMGSKANTRLLLKNHLKPFLDSIQSLAYRRNTEAVSKEKETDAMCLDEDNFWKTINRDI